MKNQSADLVIVGGGGAGMAAAVAAKEAGLDRVIVIEKRPSTGGNAVFANGIYACNSHLQRLKMIDIDPDEVYRKALEWHRYSQVNPRILRAYINKTASTIRWLSDKGIEFELGTEHRMAFNQEPSWHVVAGKGELARFGHVMKVLLAEFKSKGGELFVKAGCRRILKDDAGRVSGVEVEVDGKISVINTPRVLLSSGGFIGNRDLLQKYFPYVDDTFEGFFVPMMGDGITLAGEAGAALERYSTLVRENCYSSDKPKESFLTVAAREPNTVWVNRLGRRFVAETVGLHLQPSANVLTMQPGNVAYALYDQRMVDEVARDGWKLPRAPSMKVETDLQDKLREVAAAGKWVAIADELEGLAPWIGCDAAALRQTVDEYNGFCSSGYDRDFVKERRFLDRLGAGPYYAVKFRTLIIETAGPVRVDEHMHVLDAAYQPVPGLFAAGAITAGWLSSDYCGEHLFGSALSYAINSARIACDTAAAYGAGTEV